MADNPAKSVKPTFFKRVYDTLTDSQGNMRWQPAVVLVVILIGVCCLVGTNVGAVVSIRQSLLHNHPSDLPEPTKRARAALSDSDPFHPRWDDVKVLRVAHGSQLSAVQLQSPKSNVLDSDFSTSTPEIQEPLTQTASACSDSCAASGYSVALAGEAAASACVDICLSENNGEGASDSSTGQDLLSSLGVKMSSSRLGKLKGTVKGSLRSLIAKEGVNLKLLPEVARQKVEHAQLLDDKIRQRVKADNMGLRAEWLKAVREGQTILAARYMNAKKLASSVDKASEAVSARIALDQSLVSAARKYERSVGADGAATPEANAARKAEAQLDLARRESKVLELADKAAREVAATDAAKWQGDSVRRVESLLSAPIYHPPAGGALAADWNADVGAARAMPAGEAAAVRRSAMSDGRLASMFRSLYGSTKTRLNKLAGDARASLAARAANAELLSAAMRAAGDRAAGEARLADAERRYVATVAGLRSTVGGARALRRRGGLASKAVEGDPAARARRLARLAAREATAAANLQRAADAAQLVLRRYAPTAAGAATGAPAEGGGVSASGMAAQQVLAAVDRDLSPAAPAAPASPPARTYYHRPAPAPVRAVPQMVAGNGLQAVRAAAAANPDAWSAQSLQGDAAPAPGGAAARRAVDSAARGWWF